MARMKKYYGPETEKALKNFPFTTHRFHTEFVRALVTIKKAAAKANAGTGTFSRDIGSAIVRACNDLLDGSFDSKEQFPLPALMGGAGTSIHMNVNEVIAERATEILRKKGKRAVAHPNDHVNRGQSTNDVNPSGIKVAAVPLLEELQKTLGHVAEVLERKSKEFEDIMKLGRTHLQDAVPVTLGEEFAAYAYLVRRHEHEMDRLVGLALTLHLGGTAVGNSVNASPAFRAALYRELGVVTGKRFKPAKNLMAHTGSQSDFLAISQGVTALCMDLSKIATDLRLMSSGPRGGLGEITLAELQKGSSIMPGKVNPVLPETVNVLYYVVSGNNLAIELAAHGATLELAVMVPPIADRLIESIKITEEVLWVFADRCLASITANRERCTELLERSTAYATVLTPRLGYEMMSAVVKETIKTGDTLREVVVRKGLLTDKAFDALVRSYKA